MKRKRMPFPEPCQMTPDADADSLPPRDTLSTDVVIVGAGPAGLAAAIRLKQRAPNLEVVLLEKGAEVGAHVLSGAVIDPCGLDTLLPNWRTDPDRPDLTAVSEDQFHYLTARHALRLPGALMPPLMGNHGNFIGSLGQICQWLAGRAEALGVQIYPGFAAAEPLFDADGALAGVATGDIGRGADGRPGPDFQRGMAILGTYTLIAEGARGSLARQIGGRFGLEAGRQPQKYGIGFKEIWRVPADRHRPGLVQHAMGWPLDDRTGGGAFIYHYGEDLVSAGYVVHLNYANPYLSPFEEFQRFKTHPAFRSLFEGATRLNYGARALTEGGFQSVPRLAFPGGALIGCAAGFMNVPRIKGSHNAVLSGLQAADAVADAIAAGRARDTLTAYEDDWRSGTIGADLRPVRNVKPLWSALGTRLGMLAAGADMWVNTLTGGWSPLGTLPHGKADHDCTLPAARFAPIPYPRPDGIVTFDRLSSIYLSNTSHVEGQPCHLRVTDPVLQVRSEHGVFAGPSARYCPAGVYEWHENGREGPRLVINAQNCVHCKTCDIKDPNQNIVWIPPNGGDGPIYPAM